MVCEVYFDIVVLKNFYFLEIIIIYIVSKNNFLDLNIYK